MDRSLLREQMLWLLGSLSNFYRIPFDAALVAQQYPPPHTVASFHEAARGLGLKTGTRRLDGLDWRKLPLPAIAYLRAPETPPTGQAGVDLPVVANQSCVDGTPGAGSPASESSGMDGADSIPTHSATPILILKSDGATLTYFLPGGSGDDLAIGGVGNDVLLGGLDDDIIGDAMAGNIMPNWKVIRSVTTSNGVTSYNATYDQFSMYWPTEGGDGDDVLFGEAGNDDLFGGSGNDYLNGDNGSLPLALHGDDVLDGGGGRDQLFGGTGAGSLYAREGDDYLDGEDGDDVLLGGEGGDQLFGGAGNDQIAGDNGGYDTSGATDDIYGEAGNDIIDGQGGDDVIDGGADNDLVFGGLGDDQLSGGTGADQLAGEEGNDLLDGGADADTLFGQAGNDTLRGGADTDYLLGDLGDDVYYYRSGEGRDRIVDSGGTDWLVFNDITWGQIRLGIQPTGTPEADVLSGTALTETIQALAAHRMKSRRWRDGDIACVNSEWRVAA